MLYEVITGEYDYLPLGTHSNKGGRAAGQNAAGGFETFRITSYNVCYTKLLRVYYRCLSCKTQYW